MADYSLGEANGGTRGPGKRARADVIRFVRLRPVPGVELDDGEQRPVRPAPPDPLIDAWLMSAFPGRFLEEIDLIDFGRVLRARLAQRYEAVEERRRLYFEKIVKSLDPEDWELIREMDQFMENEGS